MPKNEAPRRKPTPAASKARAAIIRRSRRKKNPIAIEYGTVKCVDRRECDIEFVPTKGRPLKPFTRAFPTWRLHNVSADFVGAKVKHVTFWLGRDMPDMVVSRLTRVGPTISLKPTRPQRRLTAEDYALLDSDSPAEGDEE